MASERGSITVVAGRWSFRGALALVAALAFLPVADWIPGEPGSNIPPPIWPLYVLWILGLAFMGLIAWGLVKLSGRLTKERSDGRKAKTGSGKKSREAGRKGRKKHKAGPAPAPAPDRPSLLESRWGPVVLLFLISGLLYSVTAWKLFDGRPLHVDAMTQALQAHIFAKGGLSVPVAGDPRFFSSALLAEFDGRAFSQFPPGWAALLALGVLFGLPWLVAPLCGAVAVVGLFWLMREDGEGRKLAFAIALLFGLSPWIAVNSASWMSHVPSLCLILLGSAALVRGMHRPEEWVFSGLGGLGLGAAAIVRPLEGVAFGIPATVWMVARAWRSRGARKGLVAFALGGSAAIGLLLAYNWVQHGNPTLFGFELQWGPEHALGFHEAPWGPPHTFLRGLQFINEYFLALQFLFFDAPAPSLVIALAALFLARRLGALDRYLLAGGALVILGYLSFWGEGHDLGPRYLIPLAPLVAIWTVRFGGIAAERAGREGLRPWGHALVAVVLAAGWLFGTPTRWFVYGMSDPLRRVDVGALEAPAARNALVFVPASWSVQVLARLRATGMSRQQAQWFYYRVGLCRLDLALASLERDRVADPERVVAALLPLAADSASMVLDPLSGSPGDPYTGMSAEDEAGRSLCQLRQRLEETYGGYMLLTFQAELGPTWAGDGPIVAQDLHEEDRRLLAAYPDRQPYVLRPERIRGRIREFRLVPLQLDSAGAVWSTFERLEERAKPF